MHDEKEFIRLINAHQGLIHKVCIMYTNDKDGHEDLFQEIVLQLWRSFSSFRGEAKITTWMYRVALNTAISGLRRMHRQVQTEALDSFHFNVSDVDHERSGEDIMQLYRAIHVLSEVDRAMVMMVLDEVPYKDIAHTIGITQNNVRVRMNRIREKLRKIMTPSHGTGPA